MQTPSTIRSSSAPDPDDLRSTLTTIAECPVCREPFSVAERKPKLMTPCGHTMCLECGGAYCRHKVASAPGDRIACPVCRRGVRLPVGGFAALPNNLTMMKLLDVRDVLARRESVDELTSALDMVDGLSGCEKSLQLAADEMSRIKEEMLAVLHRRRSCSVNGSGSSSQPTVISSSSPSGGTAPGIPQARPFGGPHAGRSASAGNVMTSTSTGTTAMNGVRTTTQHASHNPHHHPHRPLSPHQYQQQLAQQPQTACWETSSSPPSSLARQRWTGTGSSGTTTPSSAAASGAFRPPMSSRSSTFTTMPSGVVQAAGVSSVYDDQTATATAAAIRLDHRNAAASRRQQRAADRDAAAAAASVGARLTQLGETLVDAMSHWSTTQMFFFLFFFVIVVGVLFQVLVD